MNCSEGRWGAAAFSMVALALPCDSLATVRHVPAEYPAIQAAVNAASVGDTVLVAQGTYFENVLIDRRVALLSEAGAEVTTIDGQDLASVIRVHRLVDHAVIEGFRITHGNGSDGFAGGIDVDIDFNTGGYATIRRNIVEHNDSFGGSGGVYSVRQSIVEDNLIQYNNRESGGKGVSAIEVSGIIERNVVRNNGVGSDLYNVRVYNTTTFAWNLVVGEGAHVKMVFVNGGLIHNNTMVVFNSIGPWTVSLAGPIPFDFNNNLIVHGSAGGLVCGGNGSYTIRCNDVWGEGQSYMGNCAGLEGIDGNFSEDPMFCDPPNGDYKLSAGSPCASVPGCGLVGALDVGCGVLEVESGGLPSRPRLVFVPNPVRSSAGATLSGMNNGDLVEIYDQGGRAVDIVGPIMSSPVQWHPDRDLPSGVYFARIRGTASSSTRFVLVR